MNKVTVDRALVESELKTLAAKGCGKCFAQDCNWPECHPRAKELRAALAQPAVEPVAWWVVNKTTDEKFATTRPDDWNNLNWLKYPLFTSPPPPAEPAVEPVVTLCVKREDSKLTLQYKGEEAALDLPDGEYKLFTSPAEPARTSQDVCTVPLLSDDEVAQCIKDASKGSAINRDGSTSQRIVRSAEQLVRRKAGL